MLTRADHWLRERFIFQTHIYTMRLPAKLPRGLKVAELPESPSQKYRYRIIAKTNRKTDELVKVLNESGMMFATQVVESKGLMKKAIAPKGKSVLLSIFWLCSMVGMAFGLIKMFNKMRGDEVFVTNLKDAISIFIGPQQK